MITGPQTFTTISSRSGLLVAVLSGGILMVIPPQN